MKFFIPLLLASTCLAIPQTDAASSELDRRIAEPVEARAACHPAIYGTKAICKNHCGRRGTCHRTTAGHPIYWQCRCPGASATEQDLSKRVAEPEAEADAMPDPAPEEDAVEEELSRRVAEPEAEADAMPDSDPEEDDEEDDILESRADIEARAKCVPGSYGKKKKSCTPHCKGRGKCQRASSPGIGFIWTCNCPA